MLAGLPFVQGHMLGLAQFVVDDLPEKQDMIPLGIDDFLNFAIDEA